MPSEETSEQEIKRSHRSRPFTYVDLTCYAMEQIDQVRSTDLLDEKSEGEVPRLEDVELVRRGKDRSIELTKEGRNHLHKAIDSARDENRSALRYTGMLMGFTLAFFGLLVRGVGSEPFHALLLPYLLCFLFVSILASLLGGFCFWHGCSSEHGWEDLRVVNEMGDSLITMSGWILIHTVYVALFLNLSQVKFPFEIPSYEHAKIILPIIYFLIPTIVSVGIIYRSWRVHERNELRPVKLWNVIYDFVNTPTFLFYGGRAFYQHIDRSICRSKRGPLGGYFFLVVLSIIFFAFPIFLILLTFSV